MQRRAKATPFCISMSSPTLFKGPTDLESFPYIFCRGILKNSCRNSEPDKLVDNLKNAYLSLPLRCTQCPHRAHLLVETESPQWKC